LDARALRLSIGGRSFDVPCVHTPRGTIWWIFTDESGEAAYRGIEIEPGGSSLPEVMIFEGNDLVLVPVQKWDQATKTHLDETLPFENTRAFKGTRDVDGFALTVQARLTVKKNTKWNLSVRVWGADGPVVAEGPEPTDPSPEPTGELIDLLKGRTTE
jgi:hypothetical protein